MSTETTRIENDLEQARARLDATIGALQERLSPGQLLDQALDYLKSSGGGELGRNLKQNVQDHPMPVALVGIGLTWLMMSGNGAPLRPTGDRRPPSPFDDDLVSADRRGAIAKAEAAAAEVRRTASESYEAFQERVYAAKAAAVGVTRDVGEAMSSFVRRVDDVTSRAGEMGRSAVAGATDAARGVGRTAGQTVDGVRRGVGGTVRGVRDAGSYAVGLFHDQPLLLGALGVTVGALLAAALPPTRTEDQLMGDARDDLRDRALDTGGAVLERAAQVAGDALVAASDEAQRVGLTPEGAREAAEQAHAGAADIAHRVRHVVQEAASAGRRAAERELGGRGAGEHAADAAAQGDVLRPASTELESDAGGLPVGAAPSTRDRG